MLVNSGRYYKKLGRFIQRFNKPGTLQSLGGTVYCGILMLARSLTD